MLVFQRAFAEENIVVKNNDNSVPVSKLSV